MMKFKSADDVRFYCELLMIGYAKEHLPEGYENLDLCDGDYLGIFELLRLREMKRKNQ